MGWNGYVFNTENGLYTVRFRQYSPVLGRWLERDRAGYVDGSNLYEMLRSNPGSFSDPTGLASVVSTGDVVRSAGIILQTWWRHHRTHFKTCDDCKAVELEEGQCDCMWTGETAFTSGGSPTDVEDAKAALKQITAAHKAAEWAKSGLKAWRLPLLLRSVGTDNNWDTVIGLAIAIGEQWPLKEMWVELSKTCCVREQRWVGSVTFSNHYSLRVKKRPSRWYACTNPDLGGTMWDMRFVSLAACGETS